MCHTRRNANWCEQVYEWVCTMHANSMYLLIKAAVLLTFICHIASTPHWSRHSHAHAHKTTTTNTADISHSRAFSRHRYSTTQSLSDDPHKHDPLTLKCPLKFYVCPLSFCWINIDCLLVLFVFRCSTSGTSGKLYVIPATNSVANVNHRQMFRIKCGCFCSYFDFRFEMAFLFLPSKLGR